MIHDPQRERDDVESRPTPEAGGGLTGAARAFGVAYLVLQSMGIVVFWTVLWLVPGVRERFEMRGAPDGGLLAFVFADAVFLPLVGLVAAVGLARSAKWAGASLWLHAGASMYAGLHAAGQWWVDSHLWLNAAMMVPVFIAPVMIAGKHSHGAQHELTGGRSLAWSLAQVVVFWSFFLVALPTALLVVERTLGAPAMGEWRAARRWVGAGLFAMGSAGGLWSCFSLSLRGLGTPLPLMPTRRLVVSGAYAFVRNPMAIGGLAQGLGVGLWAGSWLMIACVFIGAAIWHVGIRPSEEAELERCFGAEFRAYRSAVRCWLPRVPGYVAGR